MLVDSSGSAAGSTVTSAIRQASQATGTNFNYLLATAQVESGLNPHAGAATSSARGLFQFVEQTWLGTMKECGAALGYGRYAAAISKTASGRYVAADPAMRGEILKLRNDPTANALMAGAFTKANAAALSQRLGRPATEGELYIAHFLGAGGAAKLITLAAANPNASAAAVFAHAAQANSSIFYDRAGAPRTVAQVRDVLTGRYDVARDNSAPPLALVPDSGGSAAPAATASAAAPRDSSAAPLALLPDGGGSAAPAVTASAAAPAAPAAPATPAAPDTAGIADAFANAVPAAVASSKQIFHGLFQDHNRSAPISPLISELWSVPGAAPSANEPGAAKPKLSGILSLFRDPVQGS